MEKRCRKPRSRALPGRPVWSFLHLLAQTVCKSATLEDAQGCDYADGQECPFTSSVGSFRPGSPPSYSTGATWPQSGGVKETCVWGKSHRAEVVESCRKGWVLRDSQSSWRTESHLVNHKTIFVVARRTLSIWKIQTVFTT